MAVFSHLYSSALDRELGTDDSTRLFLSARRQSAINDGMLQFVDLTECALRQSTVASSHGVAEYNLLSTVSVPAGDYLRLSKQGPEYHHTDSNSVVTYTAGEDLFPRRDIPWLNQYDPGWRSSTGGTPYCYYERTDGGRRLFGLGPPPEITSSATGKVVLPYVAKPNTLTSDTDVPFTFGSTVRTDLEPYHQAVVHYAAYELEKLRLNTEASQAQLQQFLGYVARYAQLTEPKGPRQVRAARSYFSEARYRGDAWTDNTPYPWRT